MKKILITFTTVLLLMQPVFASSCSIRNKYNHYYRVHNGKIKLVICHKKKKTLTVSLRAWFGHRRHGDTLGACGEDDTLPTEPTVPTIEETDKVTTYPDLNARRPNIIQRVVRPGFGVTHDTYSDGSVNIFTNNENGQVASTYNTTRGIQHEFSYYSSGEIKQDVSHETWEGNPNDYYVDTYYSDGTINKHIYKTASGKYLVNRGQQATQADRDLYDENFN